jgi:hypothetical protein
MANRIYSLTAILSLLLVFVSLAQTGGLQSPRYRSRRVPLSELSEEGMPEITAPRHEYTFARLVYSGGWGWRYGRWAADAPNTDVTFPTRINYIVYSMTQ